MTQEYAVHFLSTIRFSVCISLALFKLYLSSLDFFIDCPSTAHYFCFSAVSGVAGMGFYYWCSIYFRNHSSWRGFFTFL